MDARSVPEGWFAPRRGGASSQWSPPGLMDRRFLVSGRVQGVGFRAATARKARELSLSGHARNLADGRVEVLAHGSALAVERLEQWLYAGPPLARVRAVRTQDTARRAASQDFTIR